MLTLTHALVQPADGVLSEVRRIPVRIERGLVRVLLVDQHGGRVIGKRNARRS